ncbi:hypothetical protein [Streptomyces sp. NPDC049906]|uniref:hypothetical protein n=1 Tax=Streptomyces sp. NPDC049906 TaxID=3155656 RepID=UPI003430E402
MRTCRSAVLVGAVAATLTLIAACGQGGVEGAADGGNSGVSVTAGGAEGHEPLRANGSPGGAEGSGGPGQGGAKAAGQLSVRADASLGDIVTDDAGFTLYRFDEDSAEPPKSTCVHACVTAWPPVLAENTSAASGMEASLLGTLTRADGTRQLTLAGWPMYRFAQDAKAGDVKGQGVGGTWYAVRPDGRPVAQ